MDHLLIDLIVTVVRVLSWTTLAWVFSVVIGFLCYKSKYMNILLLPVVNFFRHVSPYCWLPVIILLVGIGELPVGIVLLFSMLFNGIVISLSIFRSIQRELLETASLDGASSDDLFRYIELPITMPEFVNLYRVLWSVGWTAIIAAEMLGVNSGMGYRLLDFRYLLMYRQMMYYIMIIGGIGIATDYLLVAIHRRLEYRYLGT